MTFQGGGGGIFSVKIGQCIPEIGTGVFSRCLIAASHLATLKT